MSSISDHVRNIQCGSLQYKLLALYQDWNEEDEDLEQMIEDIDAEVDRLIVLEGFYTPLPYVPFFNLGEDEDLSSEEEEEEKDLMCKHGLHRKSRSPITGKFSPMGMEISSGKGLHWLRESFIDKAEAKRVERLYKLRKSILRKETLRRETMRMEAEQRKETLQLDPDQQREREPTVKFANQEEEDSKLPGSPGGGGDSDHDHDDGHDHDHDHDHGDPDRGPEVSEPPGQVGPVEPQEIPDVNIQKLYCNKFEMNFQNVVIGEKKKLSINLYNGGVLPVVFKIDKTAAKSKGFDVQPDKVLVMPGEPDNDRATELHVSFQNSSPKLPVGPVHVWVQMNVREVPAINTFCFCYLQRTKMEVK